MGVHGWEVPFETFRKFAIVRPNLDQFILNSDLQGD